MAFINKHHFSNYTWEQKKDKVTRLVRTFLLNDGSDLLGFQQFIWAVDLFWNPFLTIRIGYVNHTETLKEGLDKATQFIRKNLDDVRLAEWEF